MKMVARRDKDDIDVRYLVTSDVLDLKKTRALVEKYLGWFTAEDFDSLVAEAQWKASRGR